LTGNNNGDDVSDRCWPSHTLNIGGGGKGRRVNSLIVAYYKVYKQRIEIARKMYRELFSHPTGGDVVSIQRGFDNKNDV
jgi:hypothetical protein